MNESTVDAFKRTLNNLRFTKTTNKAKQDRLINALKELAFKDPSYREDIVETIRAYADIVDPVTRILIIDLIHAIISSSGDEYKDFFNEHIVDIFLSAYIHADRIARRNLFEKRQQWDSYLPKEVLKELDETIRNVHPVYSEVSERSELIACHQEKIELFRRIKELREQLDELKAGLGKPEPFLGVENSKQHNPDNNVVPIEKPQPSTANVPKSTKSSDDKVSSEKSSNHSNEIPTKADASLSAPRISKNVTKLQPISRTSAIERLPEKRPNTMPYVPESLTEDKGNNEELIVDSRMDASPPKMRYRPARIPHKDLQRFNGTSGDKLNSEMKSRSNPKASTYDPNGMNSVAGPSMAESSVAGPSMARLSVNKVQNRPLAPLNAPKPKIPNLSESASDSPNLLDTVLNDMNQLYGNLSNPKLNPESEKRKHQEERRKLALELTQHVREWDNVCFEPPRKISKNDKNFKEIRIPPPDLRFVKFWY